MSAPAMARSPSHDPWTGRFTPEWVEVLRKIEAQSTPELLAIAVIAAEASERFSVAHAAAFAGDKSVAMPRVTTFDPFTGRYPHEWAVFVRTADPMVCPASTPELLAAAIALADAAVADAAAATMPPPPMGGLERLPSQMGEETKSFDMDAYLAAHPDPAMERFMSAFQEAVEWHETFASSPPTENHHLRTLTREVPTVHNCPPPSAAMPCPLVRTASCECAVLECPPPSNKWSGATPAPF